jgi:hypothetical protein
VQAIGRQAQRAPDGAPVHYERHRPEQSTLYRLVQQHAASFIAHIEASTRAELPRFNKGEFAACLECGIRAWIRSHRSEGGRARPDATSRPEPRPPSTNFAMGRRVAQQPGGDAPPVRATCLTSASSLTSRLSSRPWLLPVNCRRPADSTAMPVEKPSFAWFGYFRSHQTRPEASAGRLNAPVRRPLVARVARHLVKASRTSLHSIR